ncbi:MAG: hemolysin family protein, partial [Kiritimatiellaeota bacterium]|nr:hemolysin family protein [Kiritimatiellota bacterium]
RGFARPACMNAALFLLVVALLMVSAFFALSETALFSLSPIQIQTLRDRDAAAGRRVVRLLENPAATLQVILLGNTLANVGIASAGYALAGAWVPPRHAGWVAIPLMTILLLFLGEITPKQVAVTHAPRLAPAVSRLLLHAAALLRPLCWLLERACAPLAPRRRPESRAVTDKEFLTVAQVGQEQGVLDPDERTMLTGILRLSGLKASDVMTPRVDLEGIDLRDPPAAHLAVARETLFPFLPVWDSTPDVIEALLDVAKFLLDPGHELDNALSPPFFVPENISLDDLLVSFKRGGHRIACVVDEYGGTAGIVSRGDILDIIMEDVNDGFEDREIQPAGPGRWLVDGATPLHAVNHALGTSLTADDSDRVAGWVTLHAAGLPRPGQSVVAQGCRATVLKRRKRRIVQVRLEHPFAGPGEDAGRGEEGGP